MNLTNRVWCSHRYELSQKLQKQLFQATTRRLSSQSNRPCLNQNTFVPQQYTRALHTSRATLASAPRSHDRGPASNESTQTDFGKMNVLGGIPPPASSIDTCYTDGFLLSNGTIVRDAGMIVVGGEVFKWMPWKTKSTEPSSKTLINVVGQWEIGKESLGILELLWPKPDLLVIGTGPSTQVLSPSTRKLLNNLGIRVEVSDTRNAAAQYNLLATERGVNEVGALMVPAGWQPTR